VDDITQASTYVPLIGGVLIPLVVALLAKLNAQLWVKSVIALVSAGLVALGVYLADFDGSQTWKGALTAFVLALVAAAASRVAVTGGADTKLAIATQGFGLGKAEPQGTGL
jgi:VIT1/CCC1 family predicted Fe2+/Mn2+ transporter